MSFDLKKLKHGQKVVVLIEPVAHSARVNTVTPAGRFVHVRDHLGRLWKFNHNGEAIREGVKAELII